MFSFFSFFSRGATGGYEYLYKEVAMKDARERRLAGDPVTLATVLDAREARALLCLTLNMPGPVKRNEASRRAFAAGLAALRAAGLMDRVEREWTLDLITGPEAYLRLSCPAAEAKAIACQVEEAQPWGRLLDADVLRPNGVPMSRGELGKPPRGCLVCGKPGMGCARSRAHDLPALYAAVLDRTDSLFEGEG